VAPLLMPPDAPVVPAVLVSAEVGNNPSPLPPQAEVAKHKAVPQAVAASPKKSGRKRETRNAGVDIEQLLQHPLSCGAIYVMRPRRQQLSSAQPAIFLILGKARRKGPLWTLLHLQTGSH
jgi:hypothetical protein